MSLLMLLKSNLKRRQILIYILLLVLLGTTFFGIMGTEERRDGSVMNSVYRGLVYPIGRMYFEMNSDEAIDALSENFHLDVARDVSSVGQLRIHFLQQVANTTDPYKLPEYIGAGDFLNWEIRTSLNPFWREMDPKIYPSPKEYFGENYPKVLTAFGLPEFDQTIDHEPRTDMDSSFSMIHTALNYQLIERGLPSKTSASTTPFLMLYFALQYGVGLLLPLIFLMETYDAMKRNIQKGTLKTLLITCKNRSSVFNKVFFTSLFSNLIVVVLAVAILVGASFIATGLWDAQYPMAIKSSWSKSFNYNETDYQEAQIFGNNTSFASNLPIPEIGVSHDRITLINLSEMFLRFIPIILLVSIIFSLLGMIGSLSFKNQRVGTFFSLLLAGGFVFAGQRVPFLKEGPLDIFSVLNLPRFAGGYFKTTLLESYVFLGGLLLVLYLLGLLLFMRNEKVS